LKIAQLYEELEDLEDLQAIEEAKGGNQIRNYCSPLITRVDNLINQYSKTLFSNDENKLDKFNLLLVPL